MTTGADSIHDLAALLVRVGAGDRPGLVRLSEGLRSHLGGLSGADRAGRLEPCLDDLDRWLAADDGTDPRPILDRLGEALEQALESDEPAAPAGPDGAPDPPVDFVLVPEDAETDFLDEFVTEARELLEASEASLLTLESNPDDREAIDTVFRGFHTIKGSGACLGLTGIAHFAHHAEDLLSRVRDGEIRFTGACAELALRSVDALKQMNEAIHAAAEGRKVETPACVPELLRWLADPEATPAPASASPGQAPQPPAVPEGAEAAPAPAAASPAATDSVRVRTERLDKLIDVVGELVISHSMLIQHPDLVAGDQFDLKRRISQTSKIVRELQDLTLSMRMIPMAGVFRRLRRVVRDLAARCGKQVQFETSGEETEIDRNMVDQIADPLVHMMRNAIDHGLESAEDREAAGKPPVGKVKLSAMHQGGAVVLRLEDDGQGLDAARILAKARERGLVPEGKRPADEEIYGLIFESGFSTASSVTEVSGRGVGMDVVRRAIDGLKGRVDVSSRRGEWTRFTVRLPLTLAIADGMQVRVGAQRFILPTISILMSFRPVASDLVRIAGRGEVLRLREELLPLFRLASLLGIPGSCRDPEGGLIVVLDDGQERYGLLVDELLTQQQVVVKPVDWGVGRLAGVSGAAILGDGSVGLILEPAELAGLQRNPGPGRGSGELDRATAAPGGGRCVRQP